MDGSRDRQHPEHQQRHAYGNDDRRDNLRSHDGHGHLQHRSVVADSGFNSPPSARLNPSPVLQQVLGSLSQAQDSRGRPDHDIARGSRRYRLRSSSPSPFRDETRRSRSPSRPSVEDRRGEYDPRYPLHEPLSEYLARAGHRRVDDGISLPRALQQRPVSRPPAADYQQAQHHPRELLLPADNHTCGTYMRSIGYSICQTISRQESQSIEAGDNLRPQGQQGYGSAMSGHRHHEPSFSEKRQRDNHDHEDQPCGSFVRRQKSEHYPPPPSYSRRRIDDADLHDDRRFQYQQHEREQMTPEFRTRSSSIEQVDSRPYLESWKRTTPPRLGRDHEYRNEVMPEPSFPSGDRIANRPPRVEQEYTSPGGPQVEPPIYGQPKAKTGHRDSYAPQRYNTNAGSFSSNYNGNRSLSANQSADIPDLENTSFWVMNLPASVNVRQLLAAIRQCGRIFAVHINGPDPAKKHFLSAAKITFFTLADARRFIAKYQDHGSFIVGGKAAHVTYNRVRVPENPRLMLTCSRVLVISGPPEFLSFADLHGLITGPGELQYYDLDEFLIASEDKQTNETTVEFRFGSFHGQAEVARNIIVKKLGHKGVMVRYGIDPCA
ncbi:hypothetical protein B0T22DRAFT_537109 [Podospora appendiculata]|uniref:RRM domain-containing protein n=1 Tax=Podospora appendiculata TaxID=314037 RepID=A0AAE1CEB9_9PEZI|nr:hypothetical protein B0T22DRAFT_537109 [Podospora appendiculata]